MIKTLTTTLMLAVASCSFSPAYAQTTEDRTCYVVQEVSTVVATLRDDGVPAGQVYQLLVTQGMPEDVAYELVLAVYTKLRNVDPDNVGALYYNICSGELL